MQVFVNQNFDDFIASGSFTQKNLEVFEKNLHGNLKDYMKNEGIDEPLGPRKAADDVFANRSQEGKFDRIHHSDANPVDDLAIAKARNTTNAQKNQRSLRAKDKPQLNVNLSLP